MPTLKKEERDQIIGRLQAVNQELINGTGRHGDEESKKQIADYKVWGGMTNDEQVEVLKEWDEYQQEVKKSVHYAIFQEARQALKENNLPKVRELAKVAKKEPLMLKKPEFTDPWEYDRGAVKAWQGNNKKIEELLKDNGYGNNIFDD